MTGSYDAPEPTPDVAPAVAPDVPASGYSEPSPSFSNPLSSQQAYIKDSTTGANITEADIKAKEDALAAREAKISNREREIEDARANGTLDDLNKHKRNFPIILKMYKYYPEEFISEDAQPLINKVMICTYIGAILLILNALTTVLCLLPGPSSVNESSKAAPILFALVYLFVMYPLSLELCLIPLYNALKDGKGLKYVGFLFSFIIYFAFFVYIAVGIGDYGSVGWIVAIELFSAEKNKWVAAIALIFSLAATGFSVLIGWVWILAFRYYKNNDIKSKAISEAAVAAGQYANEHRDEIAQAARENPELAMQAAQIASTV
jgi:hypothetical protein